jgi:hypothetical protein
MEKKDSCIKYLPVSSRIKSAGPGRIKREKQKGPFPLQENGPLLSLFL